MTGDRDIDEFLQRCIDIFSSKGLDYGEDDDRLAEFRETARENETTPEKVLYIYVSKHLRSIRKHCNGRSLKGEPVEEKILDVACYMMLLYKMARERSSQETEFRDPRAGLTTHEFVEQQESDEDDEGRPCMQCGQLKSSDVHYNTTKNPRRIQRATHWFVAESDSFFSRLRDL